MAQNSLQTDNNIFMAPSNMASDLPFDITLTPDASYWRSYNVLIHIPPTFTIMSAKIFTYLVSEATQYYARTKHSSFWLVRSYEDIAAKVKIDSKGRSNYIYRVVQKFAEQIKAQQCPLCFDSKSPSFIDSKIFVTARAVVNGNFEDEKTKQIYTSANGPCLMVLVANAEVFELCRSYIEDTLIPIQDISTTLGLHLYSWALDSKNIIEGKNRYASKDAKIYTDVRNISIDCFRYWFLIDRDNDDLRPDIKKAEQEYKDDHDMFYRYVCSCAKKYREKYLRDIDEADKYGLSEEYKAHLREKATAVYPYGRDISHLRRALDCACDDICKHSPIEISYNINRKAGMITFTVQFNEDAKRRYELLKLAFEDKRRKQLIEERSIGVTQAHTRHAEMVKLASASVDQLDDDDVSDAIDLRFLMDYCAQNKIFVLKVKDRPGSEIVMTDQKQLSSLCAAILKKIPDVSTEEIRIAIYKGFTHPINTGVVGYLVQTIRVERKIKTGTILKGD